MDQLTTKPESYVIVEVPRRRAITWKGIALACVVLMLVIGASSWVTWYFVHERTSIQAVDTSPRKFENLSGDGLSASLTTEGQEGSYILYKLVAKPDGDAESKQLTTLTGSKLYRLLNFKIVLEDKSGFQVCEIFVPFDKLEYIPNGHGGAAGIEANSQDICLNDDYSRTTKWSLVSNYSSLTKLLAAREHPTGGKATVGTTGASTERITDTRNAQPAQPSADVGTSGVGMDRITGADFFSGRIETLDGHTYVINRDAERRTIIGWEAKDPIEPVCGAIDCIVTDKRTGESVHAIRQR